MSFKLILFDADDTLFDFSKSEVAAFHKTLEPHIAHLPADDVFEHYKKISRKLWARLENKQMKIDQLKVERFRRLFKKYKIRKMNAKYIGEQYLNHLAEQSHLLDGAENLCRELRKKYRLGIVTNGVEYVQRQRLAASPLKELMELMVVSAECGFSKPDPRIFKYTLEKAIHDDPSSVLMVGDRFEADIVGAHGYGIKTCWYNPHDLKNKTKIQPDYEIRHLSDLLKIL